MSSKKNKPITAMELHEKLHADPEWVAQKKARERRHQAEVTVNIQEQLPIADDLRAAGYEIETIADLYNREEVYRTDIPIPSCSDAIPLLLRHFDRPYFFWTKGSIVRAINEKAGYVAFDRIIEELEHTSKPEVASKEKARAVELWYDAIKNWETREEVERFTNNRWKSYRDVLIFYIGYQFKRKDLDRVMGILTDERYTIQERELLSRDVRKKVKRWKNIDPSVHEVLEQLEKAKDELYKN